MTEFRGLPEARNFGVQHTQYAYILFLDVLRGLKYIDRRIPKEGQAERLMLKYYNYLWEIRRFMRRNYNKSILENLENFL